MPMDNTIVPEHLQSLFNEAIEVLHEKLITTVREELATNTGDRLKDKEQAAAYLGIRPCTLSKWITEGTAPKYSKLGSRVLFKQEWLDHFVEQHAVDNLTAPDGQVNHHEKGA
ncbi:helix-turn-helix transcriptional regulator [Desulfofustis glycolicus]|uniref:Transcriptional regulator, AlpA family n=1 Tax=Desulfofustis glycolicus DSM 9705 TaxID=1121409 RepID=A0A1M5UJS0_9BACT|nr:helix-turn-helix domain-containing protein [Desulfofustis glycolicus]SHH63076.1 transcriptional regulator, AlpA family [Desulfofustis glycolicus DSM 9705]